MPWLTTNVDKTQGTYAFVKKGREGGGGGGEPRGAGRICSAFGPHNGTKQTMERGGEGRRTDGTGRGGVCHSNKMMKKSNGNSLQSRENSPKKNNHKMHQQPLNYV